MLWRTLTHVQSTTLFEATVKKNKNLLLAPEWCANARALWVYNWTEIIRLCSQSKKPLRQFFFQGSMNQNPARVKRSLISSPNRVAYYIAPHIPLSSNKVKVMLNLPSSKSHMNFAFHQSLTKGTASLNPWHCFKRWLWTTVSREEQWCQKHVVYAVVDFYWRTFFLVRYISWPIFLGVLHPLNILDVHLGLQKQRNKVIAEENCLSKWTKDFGSWSSKCCMDFVIRVWFKAKWSSASSKNGVEDH